MKIVCDNCATKYSIADEKVRGKVFKIRCKKCSHIIVVRGNDGAGAPQQAEADAGAGDGFPGDEPPTTVASGAAAATDAVWHLVVDREQIGPLTAAEVRAKFAAGEVDVETYAWREGFGDWLRLGSIDDFRDLGASAPAHAEEGATRRTDSADLFASSGQDESGGNDASSDLFGSAAASAASAPAPAPSDSFAASGGAAGLFGAPESAPAPSRPARTSSPGFSAGPPAGGGMAAGGAAQEASDGARPMTGQRNENSVLFSLNNLQALASGGGSPAASSAPKPGVDNRPGFANSQTEGSGLIDIRAMAASTLAAGPAGPSGAKADEPAFSAAPIFSPMAAPILMPAAPSGPPKWMFAILGVGVLAVIGIVVVGVLLLTRKPDVPPVVASAAGTNPATAVAPAAGTAPAAAAAPAAAGTAPAAAGTAPAEAPKATAPEPDKTPKHAKGEKHGDKPAAAAGKHESKGESPAAVAAAPPPVAETPKHKKGGDALDDLLNNASPDKPAPAAKHHEAAAESSGGDDSLPDQLDKSAIVGGMGKVKGKVASCYDQYKVPGMANVSVTIAKSGGVSSASVSGAFAGTPTGSCVEKAVKSASFPKFKGAAQTINYPFMLR
jgi:predicted Zn finger-like uncharacterized protein